MQSDSKTQSMFELVENWQQSGKSQKQFSVENDIKLATFMYWVQKYRQDKSPNHGFASLTISQETGEGLPTPKIEIELAGGTVVRIY